ncbi:hypothetical protein NFI96_021494 [Prochilodus magdalenae]|nr:hypothetical protein NFI96_021494 [Prochilodus magdalenae]
MSSSKDAALFIDLSYLSAEEEGAIRQVLLRDEDLKRLELGRVRRLRNSVPDSKQLKVLSGEWFEDLRSKRYGRQPPVSAVVRSSMRWKKSAGKELKERDIPSFIFGFVSCMRRHKPVPFLNAVLEEKDGEREEKKTRPEVSADPRSVHPALTAEVSREYTDEDITLELETQPSQNSARNPKSPFLSTAVLESQSGGKEPKDVHHEETAFVWSPKPVPVLQPTSPTTASATTASATTASATTASATSTHTTTTTTETTITTNSAATEPRRKVSLPPALGKDGSFEEHYMKISLEANRVKSAAAEVKPTTADGNTPVETLVMTSFTETPDTSSHDQSRQPASKADSISTGTKVEAGEVTSSRNATRIQVKQTRTGAELLLNTEGSGSGEEVAQSQSLHADPKGVHELLIGSLQGQESSPKLLAPSSVEMMKKQALSSNTAPHTRKEEVVLLDFKRTSPTRMDELEGTVEEGTGNKSRGPSGDLYSSSGQNESAGANRDKLALSKAGTFIKKAGPERKDGSGVEERDSDSGGDKKTLELAPSPKMDKGYEQGRTSSDMAEENAASKEEGKNESDILASVYARALKAKSQPPKNVTIRDPKRETVEGTIPSVVIVPSSGSSDSAESSDSREVESVKNGTSAPKAPAGRHAAPSSMVDTWEDEGVDSDDDSSSMSSYGSDLSGRRGFSASTLSVTERTGSMMSVYSDAGDFGNVVVQGSVEFALMHSPLGELIIMVEQCQDLAIANPRKQRTDPYVKTYLYPDKRSKRKTSIKKRTVNPVFVESLRYKVKREELPGKTLNLSVWHNDSLGRNVFLGQVEISLKTWDWEHQALTWYNLQPKVGRTDSENQESQEYRGLLSVSLKYTPPEPRGSSKLGSGEIHVWLREARQLRRLKAQGADSFVKCYMLPDTSKKSRQKTRVVKNSLNPIYNHTMVYDGFRPDEVREACCELTIWDSNKLSNQFLGGVRLSLGTGQSYGKKVDWMDSVGEEVEVWEKMMVHPNSWVEADLPLRASMTPRK